MIAQGKYEESRVVSPQIQGLMKDQKKMRAEFNSLKHGEGATLKKNWLYKLAYLLWVHWWRDTGWVRRKGQFHPFQQHRSEFHRSLCQKWAAGKPIKHLARLPKLRFHSCISSTVWSSLLRLYSPLIRQRDHHSLLFVTKSNDRYITKRDNHSLEL